MIALEENTLLFKFPEVHADATLRVDFQRTLRIPDDDRDYPLPPGLGCFPLQHVDDFASGVPEAWLRHGGVMLPMYQSEALWLNFESHHDYPFAVKVAAGKIDAVTGDDWNDGLHRKPQDYLAIPDQPWLDGFCVEKGVIRQFVAMPLGSGYSAEEQLKGTGEFGGIQVIAYPLKAEHYRPVRYRESFVEATVCASVAPDMALAPGGRMQQEIYEDHRPLGHWNRERSSRCFVHLANSLVWRAITGENPPTVPMTAKEYTRAGLPWFEYYSEQPALDGSQKLGGLESVVQKAKSKGEPALPENEPVTPEKIVKLRAGLQKGQVREGAF